MDTSDSSDMPNLKELKDHLKTLTPWIPGIDKMKRDAVAAAIQDAENSQSRAYLVNDGKNSCYMDSIWMAFLTQPLLRKWVTGNWLRTGHSPQLRDALRDLYSRITPLQLKVNSPNSSNSPNSPNSPSPASKSKSKTVKTKTVTCKNVRKTLAGMPALAGDDTEWLREQNDPNDVLQALIHAFRMSPDVHVWRTTPSGRKKQRIMFNGIMVGIDMLYGKKKKCVSLQKKVFDIYRDSDKTSMVLEDANVLYIPVMRNYLDEEKITTQVVAPKSVEIGSQRINMVLVGMIIHHGATPDEGHYTCLIKRLGAWWLYDDLEDSLERVKSIKTDEIRENVVGFLYVRV